MGEPSPTATGGRARRDVRHFRALGHTQCIAIALVIAFPKIATYLPGQLHEDMRSIKVEDIDDSANRLEEDPFKAMQEEAGAAKEEK